MAVSEYLEYIFGVFSVGVGSVLGSFFDRQQEVMGLTTHGSGVGQVPSWKSLINFLNSPSSTKKKKTVSS